MLGREGRRDAKVKNERDSFDLLLFAEYLTFSRRENEYYHYHFSPSSRDPISDELLSNVDL